MRFDVPARFVRELLAEYHEDLKAIQQELAILHTEPKHSEAYRAHEAICLRMQGANSVRSRILKVFGADL